MAPAEKTEEAESELRSLAVPVSLIPRQSRISAYNCTAQIYSWTPAVYVGLVDAIFARETQREIERNRSREICERPLLLLCCSTDDAAVAAALLLLLLLLLLLISCTAALLRRRGAEHRAGHRRQRGA